jgi:hypothetical protein
VLSAVEGPDDIYAAGIVFVGEAEQIIAMDIRGVDDIFILDLSAPPTLDQALLYADPIPTNSGTADLAGCAQARAPVSDRPATRRRAPAAARTYRAAAAGTPGRSPPPASRA